MLKRTHYTDQVESATGTIVLAGWVHEIKDLARARFIWIRDRHGIAQITMIKSKTDPQILETSNALGKEDVIAVEGTPVKERIAKIGGEVIPAKIELIVKALGSVPLDVSGNIESNLDVRLDWRVIDLRRRENLAIFQIQSKLVEGMLEYLRVNDYLQVFTPCLLGGTSEGGAEVFKTDYFGREAFLRQDPQLHRQLCIAAGFEKIYDLGPNWRAELSHTPRHLCEHRGLAVEFGFMQDERDMMRVEEETILSGLKKITSECGRELELLQVNLHIPPTPFPEMKFPEIYDILEQYDKKLPPGSDLDKEAETLLSKHVLERYKSDAFFINRFPFKVKPFYVMRVDDDPEWARSVDFVYKDLEQSSGGQRENRYEKIMNQLNEKKINPQGMSWFTEPFKYAVPPHGGFCLGIERFTMSLLNRQNVRETVLFPRTPERLLP
ncbi:MAG TPA: aspartate--tRNA(Asn) ligase [Candidatus Bathyarchaeia archaeon]|nr:aspartate--tRNA(Asn) ligase [Candidatus Bathyarchaeia archaeon]